jgi:hypothetical protein
MWRMNLSEGNTLADLERITAEFAQAEAEKQYLMEFRKSKKAILDGRGRKIRPLYADCQTRKICVLSS